MNRDDERPLSLEDLKRFVLWLIMLWIVVGVIFYAVLGIASLVMG
jgi:hypothetical protein